jgi:tetratricopeptide (TPR) repeat protein
MWSKEELDKIKKLLLSADEDNQLLGLELLKQVDNKDDFAPLLVFLSIAESGRYDIVDSVKGILKILDPTVRNYWKNVCNLIIDNSSKTKTELVENFEKHIDLFDSFLLQAPRFSETYYEIGRKLIKNFKMSKNGLEFLRKGAEANPEDFNVNFDYAFFLPEEAKNADTIIRHYNICLSIKSSFFGTYHNLGKAYMLKGDIKKAIEVFRNCLSKFPQKWETMIELSMSVKENGDKLEARSLLEQAISINPDSHLAHNNFSFLLWSEFKNEQELALYHITKALEIKPLKGLYWHTKAEVYWYGFEDKEKAFEALHKGMEVEPGYNGCGAMIKELEAK